MKLIVGLGNPGTQYALTRHNVGFMVLDALASSHGAGGWQSKCNGHLTQVSVNNEKIIFLKPTTFMNLSGQSVLPAASYYKIPPDNIMVVHDDLDLPFGTLKSKQGGGDAGHNGLKSITQAIGANYHRLRIGIGRPERKEQVEGYVLQPFTAEEQAQLPPLIQKACQRLTEE